tara:strand:- start:6611 stop:7717 length:1107 start_codon:yes stop_codon:yes gene_type:complete
MSTLLKTALLKTNNPFIMFKHYYEDIHKADFRDLTENMLEADEPKELSPKLKASLRQLMESNPDLFQNKAWTTGREEDPYAYSLREQNVINFRNSLKGSKMYKDDPTVLNPIIEGLTKLIEDISVHQSKQPKKTIPKGAAHRPMKGKAPTSDKPNKEYMADLKKTINQLNLIKKKLETALLDFDGDLIYDESVERVIFNIIKNKHDIAQLRRLAGKEFIADSAEEGEIGKLRISIFKLLNLETTFVTHNGEITERLVDAILYAYQQKTGVVLADVADHKKYENKKHAIWRVLNEEGAEGIRRLLGSQRIKDKVKARRKRKQTEVQEVQQEEVLDAHADSLLDRLLQAKDGEKVDWYENQEDKKEGDES